MVFIHLYCFWDSFWCDCLLSEDNVKFDAINLIINLLIRLKFGFLIIV